MEKNETNGNPQGIDLSVNTQRYGLHTNLDTSNELSTAYSLNRFYSGGEEEAEGYRSSMLYVWQDFSDAKGLGQVSIMNIGEVEEI